MDHRHHRAGARAHNEQGRPGVEEVQEAEERDQRGALKEPLKELCTGGILECVLDVQLEHDVFRVRFEDKLREAAGGEAAVGAECQTEARARRTSP